MHLQHHLANIFSHMQKASYNVAHIMPWWEVGGTELATLRIAQGVAPHNFRSVMFCSASATPPIEFFREAKMETALYDLEVADLKHWRGFLFRTRELIRELKKRNIDLIHCADVPAGNFAAVAAKIARIPVICHVRNRHDKLTAVEKRGLRLIDKFVFVSRDTWRRFGYHVPERRGTVLYDGIDTTMMRTANESVNNETDGQSVRREFGIPDDVKIIGMVARLDGQKDYETLAKAARRVTMVNPKVRFLIVGSYSHSESQREFHSGVQRMLSEAGVVDYFTFTDFRRDVPRLINAMDVFVLSTNYEGLPLVIIEAMAAGKPVVATAVDGVPEIVIDGETGLLHRHRDDEQLAAQLLALLQDDERARVLGAAGRRFVQTNFSHERFVSNVVDLYKDMIGIA